MSTQGPLTSWLLSSTPQALKRATTHPFLAAAGSGTLSKESLSQWLSQDRLYAQSYIRFIGMLLSKIRLPAHAPTTDTPRNPTIEQTIIDVLIDALVNIRTELQFFESTAVEYGLDLTAIAPDEGGASAAISTTGSGSCPGFTGANCGATNVSVSGAESGEIQEDSSNPRENLHNLCKSQGECQMQAGSEICNPPTPRTGANPTATTPDCEPCQPSRLASAAPVEQGPVFFAANRITHAYIDMFMSAGSPGVSALEGMAVLWATEVCYLRAWRYAASYGKRKVQEGKRDVDADGGALREKFIPNWSSKEFEEFVNRIGDVLDQMVGNLKGVEEAEMLRARCLEWWKQVVWLEERFWPVME
jgi:thiaminase